MKPSSQNIKSSFEEDLNRLTQEIGEVGDSIYPSSDTLLTLAPFETDQKWTRPAVKPFNPERDSLSTSRHLRLLMNSVSTDRVGGGYG